MTAATAATAVTAVTAVTTAEAAEAAEAMAATAATTAPGTMAATTDLGHTVRVLDTVTGVVREYRNEPDQPAEAITDVTGFREACQDERGASG